MFKMLAIPLLLFLSSNGDPTTTTQNASPIIIDNISTEEVYPQEYFYYELAVDDYFEDPDGDVLSLRLGAETSHGKNFSDWLVFNTTQNTLEGTPSCKNVGVYRIDAFAEDEKGGSVSQSFTLSVNPQGCEDEELDWATMGLVLCVVSLSFSSITTTAYLIYTCIDSRRNLEKMLSNREKKIEQGLPTEMEDKAIEAYIHSQYCKCCLGISYNFKEIRSNIPKQQDRVILPIRDDEEGL